MWLERTPDKREVTGSTPVRPTVFSGLVRPAHHASRPEIGKVIPKDVEIRHTDKTLMKTFTGALF
jgi:hypothetical protein